jgi:CCR4-NOT transcription complex subunit 1
LGQDIKLELNQVMALLESEAFPSDIEKEANAIFSRIYDGDINMTDIIILLQNFKSSNDPRERKIFQCMIRSLYEEYPHIPKYPEKELHITGVLFGSLIQYQLVSYIPLVVALRYILEALKQPPTSKLFKFGLYALEQFMNRLHEWPQYCSHLRQIPQLQTFHPQLYRHIEAILAQVPAHYSNPSTGQLPGGVPAYVQGQSQLGLSGPLLSEQQSPFPLEHGEQQEVGGGAYEYRGEGFSGPAARQYRQSDEVVAVQGQGYPEIPEQMIQQQQPQQHILHHVGPIHLTQGGGPSPLATIGVGDLPYHVGGDPSALAYSDVSLQHYGGTIAAPAQPDPELESPDEEDISGHALNIRTLLGSKFAVVEPDEDTVDTVHFIFNNVSANNTKQKAADLKQAISEQHFDYLAQYIVVKRASLEENFHEVFYHSLQLFTIPYNYLQFPTIIYNFPTLSISFNFTC